MKWRRSSLPVSVSPWNVKLVGIAKLKWRQIWLGLSSFGAFRILLETCMMCDTKKIDWYWHWNYSSPFRSKIAGAKSFCTDPSRIATHCRQGAQLQTASCHQSLSHLQSRKNLYDKQMEYWITVRESEAYEEEHEVLQKQHTRSKVRVLINADHSICILVR